MPEEAWGRWGPDDERGALNLIDSDAVRAAVKLVRSGKVFSLGQPIVSSMPTPPRRPRFNHWMTRDGGDYAAGARRPGDFAYAEDAMSLPLHSGTHLDGLCHAWCGKLLYNGFAESEIRSEGAKRLGVEKLPPVVTRGVLLDIAASTGALLADGAAITPDHIRAACRRADVAIRTGDAVLIRTGWLERQSGRQETDFNSEPGLNVEAALLLAGCGAAVVGADNFAVEAMPFPEGTAFPVHQRLIRDYGVPLLEGLVLAALAAAGATTFLFVAAPLPVVGGTGSPVAPVAIV